MKSGRPIHRILQTAAAIFLAAVIILPVLSAGAGYLAAEKSIPLTGRRSFDLLGSSELYEEEVTLSLEELKSREDDTEEYIPHVWPVRFSDHGYISSKFGNRIDPVTGDSVEFHGGVDLADKLNTKIHASASGVVVEARDSSGFGLTILVDHGNGYQTRYSHCNSMLVAEGDTVKQGQVIATMGATGRVTGVHLDFRVYLDEVAIDPLTVLDKQ